MSESQDVTRLLLLSKRQPIEHLAMSGIEYDDSLLMSCVAGTGLRELAVSTRGSAEWLKTITKSEGAGED